MGRHLERHRIALTACALLALLAAVVAPHVLPSGGGDSTVPHAEETAPAREDAADPSSADEPAVPSEGSGAADAGPSSATRRVSPLDMREEARSVLSSYQDERDCVLARAGYVDLMGRVWSCTVQGDGWVDVCVVRSGEEGGGSVVTTVRMRGDEWSPGNLLSELGGSDGS